MFMEIRWTGRVFASRAILTNMEIGLRELPAVILKHDAKSLVIDGTETFSRGRFLRGEAFVPDRPLSAEGGFARAAALSRARDRPDRSGRRLFPHAALRGVCGPVRVSGEYIAGVVPANVTCKHNLQYFVLS
ncbi:hypothetical protein DFR48_11157 [Ciceribacter lividus]|uniref:Uncharacterized protein n=1 Tax=Ciceribacter lividus TaxID=1197950 RepID=A0A6I7HHT7_9HYPH|nr:hypothetical protein [Ciceribacter lividus]RCW21093.1 hypothetical protein DFR48_11157 [Ciceribacter lividus]